MPHFSAGRCPCALVCLSLCAQLQARPRLNPDQTLLDIRQKIAESISRLPNYLCTETVERKTLQFEPDQSFNAPNSCEDLFNKSAKVAEAKMFVAASDRLRLDVALSQSTEMYSWVGEGKFDDRALSEIVHQGTTSTGAFGTFLKAIFVANTATFSFKGELRAGGRTVLEYGFAVAQEHSGYVVSNPTMGRVTGYSGSFAVDGETLDLIRLDIHTDPLPEELEICRSSTRLDYTKVRMSNVDVLLPSEVNVRVLAREGRESHNRTVFTGCHKFLGESKLIFDEAAADKTPVVPAPQSARLPAGLKVTVALAQSIDPATAAAGDFVAGKLAHDIKDPSSQLVIRKGSKVNGRIFELLSMFVGLEDLNFAVKWESVEWNGVNYPLELSVKSALAGSARLQLSRGRWPEVRAVSRREQPGVGYFTFPMMSRKYQIPAGFETGWLTAPRTQTPAR